MSAEVRLLIYFLDEYLYIFVFLIFAEEDEGFVEGIVGVMFFGLAEHFTEHSNNLMKSKLQGSICNCLSSRVKL